MQFNVRALTVLTLVTGAVALGTLALAVATDSWLYTEEPLVKVVQNYTVDLMIRTHSGLWRVCTIPDYPPPWDLRIDFCANIDYFHQESGRVENAATSMSITRAIRIAAPYPVLALLLVVIATILSVIGNLRTDVRTLVGAVIYILSGLSLAVGIILYISSVNDEMGHRPKTSPDEPQFKYNYGWSFFFAGASFLSSELAAVLGISLYLMRINRVENMVEIIPGLEEKVDLDYLQESLASPRCSTTMIL